MINEYIVRFSKGGNSHELHISAHDEEEAIKLAEMQAKYSKIGSGKFIFQSIRLEGEEDAFLKDLDKYSFTVDLDKLKRP
jgi:hypothetical protein